MGLSGSKYRMIAAAASDTHNSNNNNNNNSKDSKQNKVNVDEGYEWLAKPGISLSMPVKSESFENLNAIGKGKFGLVFLAKVGHNDLGKHKHVAIKYIPKQMIFDSNAMERIQQELDVLNQLEHPFAIYCFGGFECSHSIGLVMEFAAGGELYHLMKQKITLPELQAKFYFCEIACLLKYLHEECNLVYRDLKPENILIDYQGHIKVCDFGFATICSKAEADLRDTCGTVMYIAPEVVNKVKHGFAVDWWALGCILVEMLTGEAPFGDSDDMNKFEIFNNITEKTPRLPFLMSFSIKALIKGLLQKDQDQRFGWSQIIASPWLKDVNWKDIENRKIIPPWLPTNIKGKPASVENFVSWTLALPTVTPSSEVQSYCRALRLPRAKGIPPAPPTHSPADVSPSIKGLKRSQSSKKSLTVTIQSTPSSSNLSTMSGNPPLQSSPSSTKLKRIKSSKVAIAEEGENENETEDAIKPPKVLRAKSQLKSSANLLATNGISSTTTTPVIQENGGKKSKQRAPK